MNTAKNIQIDKDAIMVGVVLTPIKGKDAMGVRILPLQGVDTLEHSLSYLMEAVGTIAASFAKNSNPKGITNYEDMADYVSEYITKVIMNASPKEQTNE